MGNESFNLKTEKLAQTIKSDLFFAAKHGDQNKMGAILDRHPMAHKWLNDDGRTPLSVAAEHDSIANILLLRLKGADINAPSPHGSTPLMYAAMNGNSSAVKVLIEADAEVNHKNKDGNTALIVAACKGETEICLKLLRAGATLLHTNNDGQTAIDMARDNDCAETLQLLLDAEKELAAKRQKVAPPPAPRKSKTPLIDVILDNDNVRAIELIIDGADVNEKNGRDSTALMFAAMKGMEDVFDLLVEHGADIHALNISGVNALITAASEDQAVMVQKLAQLGVDIDAQDKEGLTTLMYAADKGFAKTVDAVLQAGAKKDIENSDKETAEIMARGAEHDEIANQIRSFKKPANNNADVPELLAELQQSAAEALEKINTPIKPAAPKNGPAKDVSDLASKIRRAGF